MAQYLLLTHKNAKGDASPEEWAAFFEAAGPPGNREPRRGLKPPINLRNQRPMRTLSLWVLIILASVAVSFATAFLGLAVLMPVIGYATWHGYRDTIEAEAWPEHAKLPETD